MTFFIISIMSENITETTIKTTIENIDINYEFKKAINLQDIVNLKKYIKLTSNPTYVSVETGKSALHILAKFSSYNTDVSDSNELIVWLINNYGLCIDICDGGKWTPLHLACRFASKTSHVSTVKLLLDLGANTENPTNKGTTPIILAINESRRDSSDEVIQLLLNYGANIEVLCKSLSPLMFACRDSHVICADDDFTKCRSSITTVELLLKNGANPNVLIGNITPLILTYSHILKNDGHTSIDTLQMLIKYGANIHQVVDNVSFYNMVTDEIREQLIPKLMKSEEIIELNDDLHVSECMICFDENPNVIYNCGHICVCNVCYKKVRECYKCFETVKSFKEIKLKTFNF